MTAWPKKAQIIADFINCTIASSAVTMVIFQVHTHVVMLRYVIATRLDVAHTSMPSLSGIVVWPNITSKWYYAKMLFLSSSLKRTSSLDLMILGDGRSWHKYLHYNTKNSRLSFENNQIVATILWARFRNPLTKDPSGNQRVHHCPNCCHLCCLSSSELSLHQR